MNSYTNYWPSKEENLRKKQVQVVEMSKNQIDLSQCLYLKDIKSMDRSNVSAHPEKPPLQLMGLREGADLILYNPPSPFDWKSEVEAQLYRCSPLVTQEEFYKKLQDTRSTNELSFFLGNYIKRTELLEFLGDKTFTFGIEFDSYFPDWYVKEQASPRYYGFFFIWSFDHFPNTQPRYLSDIYKGKDFTNYFAAGGLSLRWIIEDQWHLNYKFGIGINFIEIDTFGTDHKNDILNTDTRISLISKMGLFYFPHKFDSQLHIYNKRIGYGLSLLYYASAEPLGKFVSSEYKSNSSLSGSLSALFEVKYEFY